MPPNSLKRAKKCGDIHLDPSHVHWMGVPDSQSANNAFSLNLSKTNNARPYRNKSHCRLMIDCVWMLRAAMGFKMETPYVVCYGRSPRQSQIHSGTRLALSVRGRLSAHFKT